MSSEELIAECRKYVKCDTARISQPGDKMYFIIGFNKNTRDDVHSVTFKNNERFDFEYVQEQVIASGNTEEELIQSVKEYQRLLGMTMEQYLLEHVSSQLKESVKFPTTLKYFGTDLYSAGHYFWDLTGGSMYSCRTYFEDLPFNPEKIFLAEERHLKGMVKYLREGDCAIVAICGSCSDHRGGTKSVFWTTEEGVKLGDLKDIIFSIPIAKKIIEQMPFEVKW